MNNKEFKEMMYKKPHEMAQCGNPVPATGNLRDQFAMSAMQGILSNEAMIAVVIEESAAWVSREAYIMADAMLKARGKKP
ncbi:hypothetical protein [Providencia rettgeri]|uniref:hypothetical protein n=1 Tax=Providencia rettgeri TaxID=587 RepID=UPI001F04B268|nr:hypothetical protein [Providencia rettgeri]MCG9940507.1 hypothetical protein [Providencia rettgeri]